MVRRRSSLSEISVEGRIAGWTTAALFVSTAATVLIVWSAPSWRRCPTIVGPCSRGAAAAGLLVMGAVAMLVAGIAIALRLRRRPTEAGASARYVWWLGALFAIAVWVVSWKIPAFTCERGRFDELLERCMHPPSTSTPSRWIAAKDALLALGAVGGLAIALLPRWVRATAPIVVLTWCGVLSWVVSDRVG